MYFTLTSMIALHPNKIPHSAISPFLLAEFNTGTCICLTGGYYLMRHEQFIMAGTIKKTFPQLQKSSHNPTGMGEGP